MSHVSSIVKSSYPYHGTLARLDKNGDGVLSREEIAADQRPGLLAMNDDSDASNSGNTTAGGLLAKLMQLPSSKTDLNRLQLMQPGTAAASGMDTGADAQASMALYRGTYGQYALDDVAA